jgi:hypothetical protein
MPIIKIKVGGVEDEKLGELEDTVHRNCKHEIRNSKLETSTNDKNSKQTVIASLAKRGAAISEL